jgi:hypothetical protein
VVEIPHSRYTHLREPATQFCQLLVGERAVWRYLWTPSHIRLIFAYHTPE